MRYLRQETFAIIAMFLFVILILPIFPFYSASAYPIRGTQEHVCCHSHGEPDHRHSERCHLCSPCDCITNAVPGSDQPRLCSSETDKFKVEIQRRLAAGNPDASIPTLMTNRLATASASPSAPDRQILFSVQLE